MKYYTLKQVADELNVTNYMLHKLSRFDVIPAPDVELGKQMVGYSEGGRAQCKQADFPVSVYEMGRRCSVKWSTFITMIDRKDIPAPSLPWGKFNHYQESDTVELRRTVELYRVPTATTRTTPKRFDRIQARRDAGFFSRQDITHAADICFATLDHHIKMGRLPCPSTSVAHYHGLYYLKTEFDHIVKFMLDRKDGVYMKAGQKRKGKLMPL